MKTLHQMNDVVEYCHPGTGYPMWRLDYRSSKEAP